MKASLEAKTMRKMTYDGQFLLLVLDGVNKADYEENEEQKLNDFVERVREREKDPLSCHRDDYFEKKENKSLLCVEFCECTLIFYE